MLTLEGSVRGCPATGAGTATKAIPYSSWRSGTGESGNQHSVQRTSTTATTGKGMALRQFPI